MTLGEDLHVILEYVCHDTLASAKYGGEDNDSYFCAHGTGVQRSLERKPIPMGRTRHNPQPSASIIEA